jgi:hypothetical protein
MISLGALVGILILGVGVYLGVKYVPPYWTYLSMQDPVKDLAYHVGQWGEERVRKEIIVRAKEQDLELTEEQVEVRLDNNQAMVRVTWEVSVDHPRYRHVLKFEIEKSAPAVLR